MPVFRPRKKSVHHSKSGAHANPQSAEISRKKEVIRLYQHALVTGLPLSVIHQKVVSASEKATITERMAKQQQKQLLHEFRQQTPLTTRVLSRTLPPLFLVLGIVLFGSAVVPIGSTFLADNVGLSNNSNQADQSPRKSITSAESQVLGASVMGFVNATDSAGVADPTAPIDQIANASPAPAAPVIAPTIDNTSLDYTNLSNWFPSLQLPSSSDTQQMSEYRLDIPAVDIVNAVVNVGGSNLDKNVIQYPGTAGPGQSGTPVIFGHSVLRQFYNPSEKNPRRYMSIFSKIMTLQKGDLIYVTQDNVRYTYQVTGHTVVQPDQTYILDQDYSQKSLKIVTCVPEGTVLQRGVVSANLIKTE